MTVAIKILKLEDPSINLEDIRKEVLTMKLCDNENVLTCYCCFNVGSTLWIVTPLMIKGSFLRILQYLAAQHQIRDGQGFQVRFSLGSRLTSRKTLWHISSVKQQRA